MDEWLCRTFGVEKRHDWPVAAFTLLANGGNPGSDFWLLAEPVHLQLQRDRLVLADSGNLDITQEEANSLTTALNEHFADEGLSFFPTRACHWHLRLAHPPNHLKTHSLETAVGRNIRNILPSGPDGKRWHSILNETQMLLHRHPVNEVREQRGLPSVNSIWPWGGGGLPTNLAPYFVHIWADNALTRGLAVATDTPCANVPETAVEWLNANQGRSHHLVVLDTLRTPALYGDVHRWREALLLLEKNWFGPLRQALSRDKISRLTLYAFDSGQARSFSVSRTDLWKIWLRGKSLDAYFGDS
ncbi:2,3-bisphosphoglycerate-independent phosphoglycerate mutase [Sulfuricella denitrificans skB26]|uniref:2,3-bisphosphoglycerate-independent phosphoglycerate mutase n=2 Tax=Sulfuricella denitrificans TaxID=649841 RepID=S6B2M8_SULDS|nr:2,3-bisphosphoglycerate-independent phosphoglycerate mutase [Sulfuricella denitrificans skB26]